MAYSTCEMGPGSRRDTLDDVFGDCNWAKAVTMDSLLARRAKEAVKQREIHVALFLNFAEALEKGDVIEWTRAVKAWEADWSKPNPYEPSRASISESSVRLELAKEDEQALKAGEAEVLHATVTASLFILQGIELEEARLKTMSTLAFGLFKMYFPNKHIKNRSVRDLQRALLLKSRLLISKKRYSSGTQVMTHSNALITEVSKRITQTVAKYNALYSKLQKFSRKVSGEETGDALVFQVFKSEHLVSLTSATNGPEGFKSLSWIWKVRSPGEMDTEVTKDALRIEFC
ncbi:hypothetical protein EST38_g12368 [Candolleomyces aberdarensis]|uniref:Uncharacterized protein n=1 Tax=Candolleomyces aberdarensis TaxID=2316362 RepID=A0A4Q2D2L6_9AGAR|nr:hypothetical protein EST38_g12368 [Candolleomyces aberdarensis]